MLFPGKWLNDEVATFVFYLNFFLYGNNATTTNHHQIVNVYMALINARHDRQRAATGNDGGLKVFCLNSLFYTMLCQRETPPHSGW